nr:retrovirus-related Pol polyprotein from transposon TNT 1-94 [Tanacetum cinerariifolium]
MSYMQQPMQNPKDIPDPTTAFDMALEFMFNAFQLNNTTPINNNQRSSSNPCYNQIAQSAQAEDNSNGINGNQIGVTTAKERIAQKEEAGIQLTFEEFDFMAATGACEETERDNAKYTLENNLQQTSTSDTQSDKALVYDLDGSAEVLYYAKENAHLKTTYKNLFDSISVIRTQTKTIIDSLQNKLHDTIYENAKLKAQLFDKVSEKKDTTRGTSANTKFEKQSILGKPPSSRPKPYVVTPLPKYTVFPKVGEMHALSKPITSNSVLIPTESKVVKNNNLIFSGIFRINPFKTSRVDNFVPNKHVKASVRTKPITVSQPHVITKKDISSISNGFSPKNIKSTTRTRRPQPRNNPNNDKVPSKSKSSCLSNKLEKIEKNHRNLQSSNYPNHTSSECNYVKLAVPNEKSEVICATCKQCLITANHDECVLQYVNGMKSRMKIQSVNVSKSENQEEHKANVKKSKKSWSKESLASPRKPRSFLMTIKPHNWSSSAHQELHKIEAAKFVGYFKSLANEVDASLAKHKALELEIERLLKAVVSQDIMNIVQKEFVVDTSDLQTELERTKEHFENCIIKKETEYATLWNDWELSGGSGAQGVVGAKSRWETNSNSILKGVLFSVWKLGKKEQADWRDDTDDDELEDQELEAHYMYMVQLQEVSPNAADSGPIFDDEQVQKVSNDDHYNVFAMESVNPEQSKSVHDTYPIEQDTQNVLIDSLDMNYDREEIDQIDDDNDLAKERELLASLIEKLKCQIDESKNRNKFLETSNKVLIEKLKGEIEDFKNKNKSLESSNNFFKEANNRPSETNNLLYADNKKSEAKLARRNSKEYASQMELECAKVRDEVTNLQCNNLELLEKCEGLETELLKSKMMSKIFESVQKHAINFELELQQCQEKIKNDNSFKVIQTKDFCKEREQYFEIQDLKAQLQDKGIVIRMYKLHTDYKQTRTSQLPQDSRKTNKRVSFSTRVIPTTSVSRPQLKSNPEGDRVLHNNSRGKKQEVEDQRRSVKFSKNKTSVTVCNDSLNANTLNVKSVFAMCDKCVLHDKHYMCVLNSVAKPIKKTVASESNQKPRNFTRKLYERVSVPLCQILHCLLILLHLIEIVLFIIDSGCSKHMTGNLKLLINFVEKFLGTVKFGNDQIAPILGYGDLATSSQAWLWHRRLSHLNFDTINLLSKNDIVVGLPKLNFVKDHLCFSCELGKAKRKSFHTKLTPSSKSRLQLLHMDLYGPMRVASINGKRYVLVIVDDYSRYTWTHFLRSKDETPEVLIDFLRLVQRGLQAQVRVVRTDKGTEFLNQTLHAYFTTEGILHQMSVT